jgi:tetratricopeptide (TPR) repeat protein
MILNKKTGILLVLLSIFCLGGLAQEGRGNGRVIGYVADEQGNNLADVKIVMEHTKYNFKLETVTDEKGTFTFSGFGMGVYRFIFSKEGFLETVSNVNLSGAGRNPKQNIVLKKITKVEDKFSDIKDALKLVNKGQYQEALPLLLDSYQKKPEQYQLCLSIGQCYDKLKDYENALKYYQLVLDGMKNEKPDLKGNKDASAVFSFMGEIYMNQEKYDLAKDAFRKSFETDPTDPAVAYNIAEILFNVNDTDQAISYYEAALKIKPDWSKPIMKLGYSYLNKGDVTKALEYLEKFVKMDPTSPDTPGIKEVIASLKEGQ